MRHAAIRRALSFSFLNTVLGRAGVFLTGVVLARLLAPADFGVYAVAMVALNALLAVNELGVSVALVRWQGDPRELAPTATTISVLGSGLLYAACWFAAPAFSAALGSPHAAGVVRLLAVGVLIDGLTGTPAQLLNREFKQGRRLAVDLANLVVSTGLTVALAATGFGAWSLAAGQLAGNALGAVILFRLAEFWPRPGFDRGQAVSLLRFGLPLAGASLLVIAMLNVASVVVGSMLGVVALGYYALAFNLSAWPVNVFSQIVRRVSLPAFARVQHDRERRQEVLLQLAALLAVPTLPVCALLALLALPAISTIYGSRWGHAAAALPFLVALGAVRVAGELAYDYLVALGRSRSTLALQGGWLVALLVALPIGAELDGIRGVALGQAAVALLVTLPAYGYALRRTGVCLRALVRGLARPLVGCAMLAMIVLASRAVVHPLGLQLVLGGSLGLAVYLPVVWPMRSLLRKLELGAAV